ncbi:DUF5133 domain-containing protein [Streptomyces sp. NPDC091268]|uniref:DUF5133 domain-containing protein n=1 Tax=Streptomyces sp. NPDC091268 TaxID=3365979 RepID=UPI003807E731
MNGRAVPDPRGQDRGEGVAAERALIGRATGVLMAAVPCSTDSARGLLAASARATGAPLVGAAQAALRLCTDEGPLFDPVGEALADAVHRLLEAEPLEDPVACATGVQDLGRYLNHYRAARRRTFAAPGDANARSLLDDAGYALCVLTGRRSPHAALAAAEYLIATARPRPGRGVPSV